MNKSARLNDMMLFLNDKSVFNLKDLMERYHISKSTALRDLQSLESIGMPLYSQPGRNGYYGILQNRLLSPIVFTMDEVFALYFSMLTLRAYATTPFHLSLDQLKQKFETCLSSDKIAMLNKIEKVFSLGTIQHHNHCDFLKYILQLAIEEKVCKMKYQKKDTPMWYTLQFFDISSAHGQWYATAYHFETATTQVFRCDKVLALEESDHYHSKALSSFQQTADELYKMPSAVDFEVTVTKKGVDLFHKEHYPSMELTSKEGDYVIQGFYNPSEEDFIASYFIGYGKNLLSIKPASLSQLISSKLINLQNHLLSLKSYT